MDITTVKTILLFFIKVNLIEAGVKIITTIFRRVSKLSLLKKPTGFMYWILAVIQTLIVIILLLLKFTWFITLLITLAATEILQITVNLCRNKTLLKRQ